VAEEKFVIRGVDLPEPTPLLSGSKSMLFGEPSDGSPLT
jgi:hypothetical protein